MGAQLGIVPAFRHKRRWVPTQYATYWQYQALTFFFWLGHTLLQQRSSQKTVTPVGRSIALPGWRQQLPWGGMPSSQMLRLAC